MRPFCLAISFVLSTELSPVTPQRTEKLSRAAPGDSSVVAPLIFRFTLPADARPLLCRESSILPEDMASQSARLTEERLRREEEKLREVEMRVQREIAEKRQELVRSSLLYLVRLFLCSCSFRCCSWPRRRVFATSRTDSRPRSPPTSSDTFFLSAFSRDTLRSCPPACRDTFHLLSILIRVRLLSIAK